MIISDKNFSITSTQDVQSICQPLFLNTDISYFHYARIYNDGSVAVLISDISWHKYYWEKEFFLSLHDVYFVEPGLCLTTALPNYSQEVNDARNQFNMDHKFEIIEQYSGGVRN